jgi:putative chitinase
MKMKKYTIQAGDTLGSIAKKFYNDPMKYKEIVEANYIVNTNVIIVGQELIIPDVKDELVSKPGSISRPVVLDQKNDSILTVDSLRHIMPDASEDHILKYIDALNNQMNKFGINTPLRIAHFIAQVAHESDSLKYSSENLNYSEKALRAVFGKYFPTDELAEAYARQPEKIANRVYANRMHNRDEASGDGWKFRGRGLIQLTGRDNYTQCGLELKLDLINHPELLSDQPNVAVDAAAWFWNKRNLNADADKDDISCITKMINGGYNGLEDRKAYLARAKEVLNLHENTIV